MDFLDKMFNTVPGPEAAGPEKSPDASAAPAKGLSRLFRSAAEISKTVTNELKGSKTVNDLSPEDREILDRIRAQRPAGSPDSEQQ